MKENPVFASLSGIVEDLKRDFGDVIVGIMLFGSAVKEEKPRDIDVLIIYEDSTPFEKKTTLLEKLNLIEEKNKKMHFQVLKLSQIWLSLFKAEPWIITALSNGIILYQKGDSLECLKKIALYTSYFFEEKTERLIERARRSLKKVERAKVEMFEKLSEAVIEALQILLLIDKKLVFEKKRIIDAVKKYYKDILGEELDEIIELLFLYEKYLEEGTIRIKIEEMDHFLKKARIFLKKVKDLILQKIRKKESNKQIEHEALQKSF